MKIIVAPNALKGSLIADQAADAIISGIKRIPRSPEIIKMPVAQDADLVLTAEGQIDNQTVCGKAPAGVARLAKKHKVPCIALAGSIGPVTNCVYDSGITAIFSLCPGPITLKGAMDDGAWHLSNLAEQILRVYLR